MEQEAEDKKPKRVDILDGQLVNYEPQSVSHAAKLASWLGQSTLMPEALRGKPSDILVMIITGHEIGLSPMQSIRGMNVIKGKAVMSADLMIGLVKRGQTCKYFRLVASTDDQAVYETLRDGDPEPTRLTYTLTQATKAGLAANDNYKKHPAAMLRARCSSALARIVYPDILAGVYETSEGEEIHADIPRRPILPPKGRILPKFVEPDEAKPVAVIGDASAEDATLIARDRAADEAHSFLDEPNILEDPSQRLDEAEIDFRLSNDPEPPPERLESVASVLARQDRKRNAGRG